MPAHQQSALNASGSSGPRNAAEMRRTLRDYGYVVGKPRSSAALVGRVSHIDKRDPRQLAIGAMVSFSEVLACVPSAFQAVVAPGLRSLAGLAAKWVGVQQSLDNLLAHKARKTWPPSLIGVHFPKLELTAEFAATNPSGLGEVKETYDKFRGLVLDKHIEHYGLLMKDYRDLKGEAPVKDDHGNTIRIEPVFAESALFKKEFDNLLVDLPILASRVITLERNRYYEAKAKRAAKESLRQETDVVMGDLTTDNAAAIIDARVNSVLEKRLRSMRLVGGKGARGVSKVGPASSNIKSTKQTPKLKPATQKKSGGGPSRPRQPSSNKSPKPQAKASSSASRKGKGKQRQ
ncbi:hypothetical protein BDZ97DRAFT_1765498 [Flammula alnicola]|nr:hypothetical protein BDZ97DRAFT_1765498 [Flammula alnicola]